MSVLFGILNLNEDMGSVFQTDTRNFKTITYTTQMLHTFVSKKLNIKKIKIFTP